MLPFDEEQQSFNKSPLDRETLMSGQFWGELRVFLAVAKSKSFNRAAEMTNTSQPTVSRQVKRLRFSGGLAAFCLDAARRQAHPERRSACPGPFAARLHAPFPHQRFEGGEPPKRKAPCASASLMD